MSDYACVVCVRLTMFSSMKLDGSTFYFTNDATARQLLETAASNIGNEDAKITLGILFVFLHCCPTLKRT
jgi:hypothetical protein